MKQSYTIFVIFFFLSTSLFGKSNNLTDPISYRAVNLRIFQMGHQSKWCKGAISLVSALTESPLYIGGLENGSTVLGNDIETILSELNLEICDYAITRFHELIFGNYAEEPLIGEMAYIWDKNFVEYEQKVVAPPIYKKAPSRVITKFQAMADRNPINWHGLTALVASPFAVFPQFDAFDPPGKVTDAQFRTDLPLLMLYLDIHKPTAKSFISHLAPDGTLNDEYKKKIRPYAS